MVSLTNRVEIIEVKAKISNPTCPFIKSFIILTTVITTKIAAHEWMRIRETRFNWNPN